MGIWKDSIDQKKADILGIGKGKTISKATHQTGTSIKKLDKSRDALPPGKRVSKYGNIYYEYRKNRTDMIGERI